MVELLAPALDLAVIGKLAEDSFERRAIIVLEAEGAGKLARADLARLPADEGENVFFRRKRGFLAQVRGQRIIRCCGHPLDSDCRAFSPEPRHPMAVGCPQPETQNHTEIISFVEHFP